MKKIALNLVVMVVGVFLAGCATAGIAKPSIPMREQCVIDLNKSTLHDSIVTYGGINLSDSVADLAIVPAGKNRLTFVKKHESIASTSTSGNTTTTVYHIWWERWEGEFEFEPGKYYIISLKLASVSKQGTTISTSDPNVSLSGNTLTHNFRDIEITQDSEKNMGAVYVDSRVSGILNVNYDYGPSIHIGGGPTFGVQIISGWFNMFLGLEADVGLGMTLPIEKIRDEGLGTGFAIAYNYAALAKFSFGPVVLSACGGMGNGNLWYSTDDPEKKSKFYSSVPYAEVGLGLNFGSLRSAAPSMNIYARYYFTDDEYNSGKVFFGFKRHG